MRIAVLGTGMVGMAHAEKLLQLGHEVVVGTRSASKPFTKGIKVDSFSAAAEYGELVIEALRGDIVVEVLDNLKAQLNGKILIDISNALDFSTGNVQVFTANGPSLGEQIQKNLADSQVVKAFNTMNSAVQVDPGSLAGGDHHLFIAGDNPAAKDKVSLYAKDWYGWSNIIDLGDIKAARGMEMLMPFWLDARKFLQSSSFNYKIVN